MAKKLYDNKTGEIIEVAEVIPFARLLEPKVDLVDDGEYYEPGTSVTSLEGYEPLESIVARCMRTVQSPNGSTYQVLDTDALKMEESSQGIYEASGAKTLDEAFATMDPTESQGFDLADASAISQSVQEHLTQELPTQGGSDDNLKSKTTDEVVDNSEEFPEKKIDAQT